MKNHIFPFFWLREQTEEVLRKEIEKVYECGIRAVCLESRPHPDFMGPQWWRDFDIILDECHKRDMKIWILDDAHFPTGQANGLIPAKYPERARKYAMMQFTDCVGPLSSVELDVNLFMTRRIQWIDFALGMRREEPLLNRQELLSVTAMPLIEKDRVSSGIVNITDQVDENGWLHWNVPAGVWRICVSFTTYDFGSHNDYINYIDRESVSTLIEAVYEPHYRKYKEEFGKTISGFFSDEPGFYNVGGYQMNNPIGRRKMAIPWGDELQKMMDDSGADWRTTLPLLWLPSDREDLDAAERYRYMDYVTRLYEKNFCRQLGEWCAQRGVEYIGHVIEDYEEHSHLGCGAGHYYRATAGQHMAGIDNIGGQIIPGNPLGERHGVTADCDGKFYSYGLVKMGASAAQTDPMKKGRLMCETFGAYGWNYGVKAMKWISDDLLFQGVNYFVPHAFSMAEYPDEDCPPHFYARGNNPQFPYFAELMKYVNRMSDLLSDGQNVPQTAVIYPAESDWMGISMKEQDPMMELIQNQIDFELLAVDIFDRRDYYGVSMRDGVLTVNNRKMYSLIIPQTPFLDARLVPVIAEAKAAGIPVLFVDEKPAYVISPDKGNQPAEGVFDGCETVALADLSGYLLKTGLAGSVVAGKAEDLLYYRYQKENAEIHAFFNTSLHKDIRTELAFEPEGEIFCYDGMTNTYRSFQGKEIRLRPYESLVLITGEMPEGAVLLAPAVLTAEEADSLDGTELSENWMFSKVKAIDYPAFPEAVRMEKLVPVSSLEPAFSGVMRYEKQVELKPEGSLFFTAEHVYENAELFVNGRSAGKKLTPDYIWNITELVKEGTNEIVVEVANTPARDALKNAGIFGPEREILEPSGMFGRVRIVRK